MRIKPTLTVLLGLILSVCAWGQVRKITGHITDIVGVALSGVTIKVKNTNTATTSNSNGNFSISTNGTATLVLSAVGYQSREYVVGAEDNITISLLQNTTTLDEVVVTALGVKREKRMLTYSTQQVQGDEVLKSKEPNILNGLTGKISGVQITSASGMPGSSSRIVIRGVTSFYGDNQALIVLDGIPINNAETSGTPDGGPGTNRLADLDPSIIENVNVLKGAAATALYGSAGARGVVIITTKRGAAGKPVFSFSTGLSYDKPIYIEKQYKYAQGDTYNGIPYQYYDGETLKTSSSWGPAMDTLVVNGSPAPTYDPLKLFFQTGVTTNTNFTVTGGNNSSDYVLSYTFFDQKGTVPNTDFKRHTLFTKYNTKILDNLSLNFQMNYSYTLNNKMPEGYGLESPIWTVYAAPVSYNPLPYLNPDGSQRLYRYSRNNPYWVLNNILNTSTVNRVIPLITLNYTPTPWLSIMDRMGADMYGEVQNYHVNIGDITYATGRIVDVYNNFRQFNNDLIVQGRKQFGKFSVALLLGNNVFSNYLQTVNETGTGLSNAGFYNMSNAQKQTYSENHYLTRKVGFYSQAEVAFNNMLILSLTGRYDGSSVLSTTNSFYPYGSAAVAYIFSELFSPELKKKINFGKFRISYATVGNDNVQPYQLTTPFSPAIIYGGNSTNINFPYGGQNGFMISNTLGNANLKNELLKEFEVGLEAKFLNNRLGFEASYFDRKTSDGIIPGVTISPATGYTGTTVNSAEMQTKGFELLLTATPIRTSKFNWDITFNFSKLNNNVNAIYPGITQIGNGQTYIFVNQPYGVLYGTIYAKTANGQLRINSDGLPYTTENGIMGNITAKWLAGIINTFNYSNFGLSFFFDMKEGGDVFNSDDSYGYFYGTPRVTENRQARVVQGISDVDGKPNTVAVSGESYYRQLSGILQSTVQDGTYIKLRYVNLSYSFRKLIQRNSFLKDLSLVVTGKNLWIYKPHFTGSDPEVNSFGSSNGAIGVNSFSAPTSRSVNFTLQVVF
jgi:TonB-linked SusC/RagA family outer membrane protein